MLPDHLIGLKREFVCDRAGVGAYWPECHQLNVEDRAMPRATTCMHNGREVTVVDAIQMRDHARPKQPARSSV